HQIRVLYRPNKKAFIPFLDIKRGLSNVFATHLSSILYQNRVPVYLVAWVHSFLTNCKCFLFFHDALNIFSPISVRTPQGSPISYLLLVIFVFSLHLTILK